MQHQHTRELERLRAEAETLQGRRTELDKMVRPALDLFEFAESSRFPHHVVEASLTVFQFLLAEQERMDEESRALIDQWLPLELALAEANPEQDGRVDHV